MRYLKSIWIIFIILSFLLLNGCGTSNLPVINYFSASPGEIYTGESTHLNWSVTNASSVTIDQGIGNVVGTTGSTMGIIEVSPSQTTTYTMVASNDSGTVTLTFTVQLLYNILGYWAIAILADSSGGWSLYPTFTGSRESGQVLEGPKKVVGSYTVNRNQVEFTFLKEYWPGDPSSNRLFTLQGELTDNEHMSGDSVTVTPPFDVTLASWHGIKFMEVLP